MEELMNGTRRTQIFIGFMVAAAASLSAYSALKSQALHFYFALTVLLLAAATSRMKVKLPGINGNMSVNLPFLLVAIVNLSAAEVVVITVISTLVQCWPKRGAKLKPEQMTFNISMIAFATCLASAVFHAQALQGAHSSMPLGLALATATLLLGQTIPVAAILAVSEGKSAVSIWRNLLQLSFPYYVVSAGVVSMLQTVGNHMGWTLALGLFPAMYGIHASYHFYFSKMADSAAASILTRAAHA
jgi:hypothetical protein